MKDEVYEKLINQINSMTKEQYDVLFSEAKEMDKNFDNFISLFSQYSVDERVDSYIFLGVIIPNESKTSKFNSKEILDLVSCHNIRERKKKFVDYDGDFECLAA